MSNATKTNDRVWFVTGTSRGFGREFVRAILARGERVVATSRDPNAVAAAFPEAKERLLAVSMDLLDEAQIAAVVATAVQRFGRIDVLVNNAGHGLLGAVEEVSDAEVMHVFQTNVFGLLRVTRAVLPYFRQQKHGQIVNLSSIAGIVAGPGWGLYSATKFALEGLSEALAKEVEQLGIGVTIVEPGPFRTDFLGGEMPTAKTIIADYADTVGKTRVWREDTDGKQQGDPVLGVAAIIAAVTADKPPRHLLLGSNAYERAVKKLDELLEEYETGREVSFSTDYKC